MKRLFDSLHDCIDYFVISDTGSNDNTIEIINELSSFYKIPGKVVQHDWVDFAHNRNLALQSALHALSEGLHNCGWLMIIDADEELRVTNNFWRNELKPHFSFSAFKKLGNLNFKHSFLLWIDGQEWIWKGKVHNYLVNKNTQHQKLFMHDLYIRCHQSEGAKSHRFRDSMEKGRYDIEQLSEELGSEPIDSDNVHRFFQLAYAYRDVSEHQNSLVYFKLIADFEMASLSYRYISSVFVAKYLLVLNGAFSEIENYLSKAIVLDQGRKEAYYYLAICKRKQSDLSMALSILEKANTLPYLNQDYVVMEEDIYLWKIKYELAFVYSLLDKNNESIYIIMQMKKEGYVPVIELGFLDSLLQKMRN